MENKKVIQVKDLTKMYKLYDKPSDRLKEALGLTRKKLYKEHYALHDVNFDIYEGECVGIIGTNGSGKSTILKIITGVLTPTAGEVKVDGRISALLELGAGFNMEYSGLENVYLNGTMIGFSKEEIDARLNDILEFADIGDFIHQPVKTYSSGMFVRLAFAVAINIDPEILVVDEALSVGDVFFQAKCYHKFEHTYTVINNLQIIEIRKFPIRCIQDDCKQHKECMHKHGRNDLDYRKHTDIKNDFFYQIIVFQQRICPPHQRILEKEPWHNTCYQIKNKRNSQIPCSGTKTYREYKPVYQDRDHRLDKRPHNSQIRTCISCFEIILCKLCNKPSVLINIHR